MKGAGRDAGGLLRHSVEIGRKDDGGGQSGVEGGGG